MHKGNFCEKLNHEEREWRDCDHVSICFSNGRGGRVLPLARGLGAWYLGKDLQHNCFGARQYHMEYASFMRIRLFFIIQYCVNVFGFVTGLYK